MGYETSNVACKPTVSEKQESFLNPTSSQTPYVWTAQLDAMPVKDEEEEEEEEKEDDDDEEEDEEDLWTIRFQMLLASKRSFLIPSLTLPTSSQSS